MGDIIAWECGGRRQFQFTVKPNARRAIELTRAELNRSGQLIVVQLRRSAGIYRLHEYA